MYSFSEIRQAQRCLRKYYYSRERRLEREWPARPRKLGSWLHELMSAHHAEEDWQEVQDQLVAEHHDLDAFEELVDLPVQAFGLMQSYVTQYPEDHARWKVLHNEESFQVKLEDFGDVAFGFTPDLVIEESEGGIWIVDHKSTISLPEPWDNMDDLQHLTYLYGMRKLYGDRVKGFIFNWLRTKPPTIPKLRKDGLIRDIKRVDTTYNLLLAFAEENDVPHYPELTDRLAELHGNRRWFRRDYLIVPEIAVKTAERELQEWFLFLQDAEAAGIWPRVVLPKSAGVASCSSCEFQPICRAELMGIGTKGILLSEYKERESLNRTYVEIN